MQASAGSLDDQPQSQVTNGDSISTGSTSLRLPEQDRFFTVKGIMDHQHLQIQGLSVNIQPAFHDTGVFIYLELFFLQKVLCGESSEEIGYNGRRMSCDFLDFEGLAGASAEIVIMEFKKFIMNIWQ